MASLPHKCSHLVVTNLAHLAVHSKLEHKQYPVWCRSNQYQLYDESSSLCLPRLLHSQESWIFNFCRTPGIWDWKGQKQQLWVRFLSYRCILAEICFQLLIPTFKGYPVIFRKPENSRHSLNNNSSKFEIALNRSSLRSWNSYFRQDPEKFVQTKWWGG